MHAQVSSTELISITVKGEQREYLLHIPASATNRHYDLSGPITSVDAIATTPAITSSSVYTIMGTSAPDNYKGILIKNGKKQVEDEIAPACNVHFC